MKLPDFYKFEPLNRLRNQMGIADDHYGSFSPKVDNSRLTVEELDRLTGDGIDVYFKELTILKNENDTFGYKGNRVLLYIRDVHLYRDEEREPRYHLCNCATLVNMTQNGRFERYVISTKSNGHFLINLIRDNRVMSSEHRRLRVCQNCLDKLSLNGFSRRMRQSKKERIVAEFTPDEFFRIYPRSLHAVKPKHDSDTAPLNDYPTDFPAISESLRRENGYRCEKCGNNFSHRRQDLHVHHVNGVRWDNERQNLKILCVACHAKEPQHSHMRKTRQLMPTL